MMNIMPTMDIDYKPKETIIGNKILFLKIKMRMKTIKPWENLH